MNNIKTESLPSEKRREIICDILDFRLNSVYNHSLVNFIEPADVLIQPETVADFSQAVIGKHTNKKNKQFTLRADFFTKPSGFKAPHLKLCVPQGIVGSLKMYKKLDLGDHPVKFGGIHRRGDYNNLKNLNL